MDDTGDANPANKLLTESGERSVVKRSRPTESPRKMSYLALDRRTAKPPFVGSNPTRASRFLRFPYARLVFQPPRFPLGKLSSSANSSCPWCLLSLVLAFAASPPRIPSRASPARLLAACKFLQCGGKEADS